MYQQQWVGGVITCCLISNIPVLEAKLQLEQQCNKLGTQSGIALFTWVVSSNSHFLRAHSSGKLTLQVSSTLKL